MRKERAFDDVFEKEVKLGNRNFTRRVHDFTVPTSTQTK